MDANPPDSGQSDLLDDVEPILWPIDDVYLRHLFTRLSAPISFPPISEAERDAVYDQLPPAEPFSFKPPTHDPQEPTPSLGSDRTLGRSSLSTLDKDRPLTTASSMTLSPSAHHHHHHPILLDCDSNTGPSDQDQRPSTLNGQTYVREPPPQSIDAVLAAQDFSPYYVDQLGYLPSFHGDGPNLSLESRFDWNGLGAQFPPESSVSQLPSLYNDGTSLDRAQPTWQSDQRTMTMIPPNRQATAAHGPETLTALSSPGSLALLLSEPDSSLIDPGLPTSATLPVPMAPPRSKRQNLPPTQNSAIAKLPKNKVRHRHLGKALLHHPSVFENVHKDSSGTVQGISMVFGAKQQQRTAFSPARRLETAMTRRGGACIRCRILKKRCPQATGGSGEPCNSCAILDVRILRVPCFRSRIPDAQLFRRGNPAGSPLWGYINQERILKLKGEDFQPRKWVTLSQRVGHTMTVLLTRFDPGPETQTSHDWVEEGEVRKLEMPPYKLGDIGAANLAMMDYIQRSTRAWFDDRLEQEEPIGRLTTEIALRYADLFPNSLVKQAIDFYVGCRITCPCWGICGEETLGIEPIPVSVHPFSGITPIPPILDTQLDQIVIQLILVPLSRALLHQLERKMLANRPENWFEIYLTTFLLLANAERLQAHAHRFARRYGLPTRFNSMSLVEGYFHGCKTLLAHFHFLSKGHLPLQLQWRPAENHHHGATMDKDSIDYMQTIGRLIENNRKQADNPSPHPSPRCHSPSSNSC